MTGWLPPLRLAGVEVRVHALLFAVPALLAATAPRGSGGAPWRLGVFGALVGCVLVHEMGHALAARARGLPATVSLHGFGAWARVGRRGGPGEFLADEWTVALAGPLASLALAVVVLGVRLATGDDPIEVPETPGGVDVVLLVTTAMAAVNLLPVFPLDGGRVLRALLAYRLGWRRATTAATATSVAGIAGLVALALAWRDPWGTLLLGAGALFVAGAALRERQSVATLP